jgi:hypothetical protein
MPDARDFYVRSKDDKVGLFFATFPEEEHGYSSLFS